MSAPKPPAGLAVPGLAFWRDTLAAYELRSDERVVLDKACRTLDDLARLEAALADAPLTTVGSAGQLRAHPLLGEVRGYRTLLGSLLRQLDLPEVQADGSWRTATSERKRRRRAHPLESRQGPRGQWLSRAARTPPSSRRGSRTSPGDWATPAELDRLDALCALLPDRRAANELRHVAGHMAYYRIMLPLPADYDPTAAEIEEWRGTARRLLVTERRRRAVREWAAAAGIGADEAFGRVDLAAVH